jgi:hypothetical protein
MSSEYKLQLYRAVQEDLSTRGPRVTLVGTARKERPCPSCRNPIALGASIVNFGQVNDRWRWICLSCAPDEPLQLPRVRDAVGDALDICSGCDRPFIASSSENDLCRSCLAEPHCSTNWDLNCEDVTCCGYCNKCGASADCENCEGSGGNEAYCCGWCENCSEAPLQFNDYCDHCKVSFRMSEAGARDDQYDVERYAAEREQREAQARRE